MLFRSIVPWEMADPERRQRDGHGGVAATSSRRSRAPKPMTYGQIPRRDGAGFQLGPGMAIPTEDPSSINDHSQLTKRARLSRETERFRSKWQSAAGSTQTLRPAVFRLDKRDSE